MIKPLTGAKIAVLVANGFDEDNFIFVQKMMQEMGATMRIISTNQGLVNGWDANKDTGGWGHNYAVDAPLNTALGVDYTALIIPGGQRSIEKLKLTAHTRRFIGSFVAAKKAIAVIGDAVQLMAYAGQLDGRRVSGPAKCRENCTQNGALWSEDAVCLEGMILTGVCDSDSKDAYFSAMGELFMQNQDLDQAA